MTGRGKRRRQLWLVLALLILLVMVSWSVVAIIDGLTRGSEPPPTAPPGIERTRVP